MYKKSVEGGDNCEIVLDPSTSSKERGSGWTLCTVVNHGIDRFGAFGLLPLQWQVR